MTRGLCVTLMSLALCMNALAQAPRHGGNLDIGFAARAGMSAPDNLGESAELAGQLLNEARGCRLFRGPIEDGTYLPVLAYGVGDAKRGRYTLPLVDGARFHDGRIITSQHVVASLMRTASGDSPVAAALRVLRPEIEGDLALSVRLPAGVKPETVMELLAHESAEITALNSVGEHVRCGAFTMRREGDSIRLVAFEHHPRGRPFLDRVTLRGFEDRGLAARWFLEGKLSGLALSHERVSRAQRRRGAHTQFLQHVSAGWVTHYLAFSPSLNTASARPLRAAIWSALRHTEVHHQLEGKSYPGLSLWPPPLQSFSRSAAPPLPAATAPGVFRIGVDAQRAGMSGLANAVASELERALGTAVELVALTTPAAHHGVDAFLVSARWRSRSPQLAVEELALRLGQPGCDALRILTRSCRDRAIRLEREVVVVPVAHEQLSLTYSARIQPVSLEGSIRLEEAWEGRE